MKEILLKCETITPMFCYGADGETPEIRAQSIKGLLRFWWRTMQNMDDSRQLFQKEGEIFGFVGGGGKVKARKSPIIVRIPLNTQDLNITNKALPANHTIFVKSSKWQRGKQLPILNYMAYGVYDFTRGGTGMKDYITENSTFEIILQIPKDDNLEKELMETLALMSGIGGIGAKSRNGFGSFRITNVNIPKVNELIVKYQNRDIAPFVRINKKIKVWETSEKFKWDWDDALAVIAKAYKSARDKLEKKHHGSKRRYIAWPLNISNPVDGYDGKFKNLKRRAKPYFMRVLKRNGRYVGRIYYIPSLFANNKIFEDSDKHHNKFMAVCQEFNQKLSEESGLVQWEVNE